MRTSMRTSYLRASRIRENGRLLQDLVPEMASWKKYARIILPHVGLILLSMIYVVGGALIFYQLERPNEMEVRRSSLVDIRRQTELMLDSLWAAMNDTTEG
uniref:RIC3 domain-containing protein n=1 Tax=Steinernema glaseri TaxID=37863 RepID=A0A1I7Z1E1_9BILA